MDNAYKQALGKLIASKRKAQGLTITKFSMMVGLSRPTIYHVEKGLGNSKVGTLNKIAEGLGTTLSTLLEECDAMLGVEGGESTSRGVENARTVHYELIRMRNR